MPSAFTLGAVFVLAGEENGAAGDADTPVKWAEAAQGTFLGTLTSLIMTPLSLLSRCSAVPGNAAEQQHQSHKCSAGAPIADVGASCSGAQAAAPSDHAKRALPFSLGDKENAAAASPLLSRFSNAGNGSTAASAGPQLQEMHGWNAAGLTPPRSSQRLSRLR